MCSWLSKNENDNTSDFVKTVINSFSYNLEEAFIPNSLYSIFKDKNNLSNMVINNIKVDYIDKIKSAYKIEGNREFIIYFGNTIDEVLVIIPNAFIVEKENAKIYKKTVSEAILDYYPCYKEVADKNNKTRKQLVELDINECVAGLEAQVDILTKILLYIIDKNNIRIEDVDINSFANIYKNTSLYNVKTEKGMLEKIEKTKTIIRNVQRG